MYDLFGRLDGSTDIQDQSTRAAGKASLLRAEGRLQDALEAGLASLDAADVLSPTFQGVKHGVIDALEAALALGESAKAEELFAFVDGIPLASRSRYMDAHVQRLRARTSGNAEGLLAAARSFGEIEVPFWAAVARLEHAELTGDDTSRAEIFEGLRARPWIERTSAVQRDEVVA